MTTVVVGAGIAGSSFATALREAGRQTVVVSDPDHPPDSLAGAVVLRRAWHHGDERNLFDRSMQLYEQRGVEVARGGLVTSYRRPFEPGRPDKDWALIDPAEPLVRADLDQRVSRHVGADFGAERVIWCPGVYTARVSGITWGVTWVHDDPAVLAQTEALTVHVVAPYKTIVAGVVGGHVRLGSSSAKTLDKAAQQAEHLLALFKEVGLIRSIRGWTPRIGRRCTANGGDLGGLHRTGYALAPALAERAVRASIPTGAVKSPS
ncbi:oxidoreductase [Mycobacterium phage Phelemich]|uniref:Oxidoreductase n=2 Tax=Acadianvirus reprobate TaxID=1982903 RepID=S5YQU6_9CAUD|nr:oxidoreductase [Mycobacterium phage Phelemich]YP_008409925.1 hypothetical protein REPROBATE_4 [Mycobacterium phage Reprobate]AGT12740.1 hypothetical protein REPROBATE_4 [Mycobacterium phage Reprobate]AGT13918.1 oxidoreductase [Mycobacterium phage Phelemich]